MDRNALFLSVLTVLSPVPVLAGDLVAQEGTDVIRITEQACTNQAILERIEPEARPHFRAASAVVQGQTFKACWGPLPTAVYLIYEDGDQGVVPVSRLKAPVDI